MNNNKITLPFQNLPLFFVECGAYDGEYLSNTLTLERHLGWSGLLVEGNPSAIGEILSKHRKASLVPFCASTTNFTMVARMGPISLSSRIDDKNGDEVKCLPLTTMFSMMNIRTIDFLSLDVEGFEFRILKTIDFKTIDIKVI